MALVEVKPVAPELLRLTQLRPPSQWTTDSFGALKMSTLHRILRDAEKGDLEDFADLCEYMLATDPHMRALYETRVLAVSGSAWALEPASDDPQDVAVSEMLTEELRKVSDIERMFGDLLHAVALGWATAEHRWSRDGSVWRSDPQWIHPRDVGFANDWTIEVRTWEGARAKWIRTADHAGKFIVHAPRTMNATPVKSGVMVACAWPWLFKRYNEKFRNAAMERFGTPKVAAFTPPAATQEAITALQEGLESLSYDHVAVFEAGIDVRLFEPAKDAGSSCNEVIAELDNALTKAWLGSTLNTEVGATGGNRALGESQFATTILPRLQSDASRLANTIERDYFRVWIQHNAHLFGGSLPRAPRLTFKLIPDAVQAQLVGTVSLAASLGVLTVDELRRAAGFESLATGGDEFVAPTPSTGSPLPMSSAPASHESGELPSFDPPGGAGADVPFSPVDRGPILSRSPTPLALALCGQSATSTRSSSPAQPPRRAGSKRGARKSRQR